MNVASYVEVNIICIIVLLLFWGRLRCRHEQYSTDNMVFNLLLWATVLFCVADSAAGVFRGMMFPGARVLIQASNLIYFEALTVIGFLWLIYVLIRLEIMTDLNRKKLFLYALPLIAFSLIALFNPFTHFLFSIDENNLYVRSSGVYIHWLISWAYLVIPTVLTARAVIREKNKMRRAEILPLLYFIIAPIIASIVQMIFYGISTSQAGITISIVVIFLMLQGDQVLTDALTGLNNRRGLTRFYNECAQRHSGTDLCLLMLDLDNFKQVNDRFGHMTGDKALIDAANALKSVCSQIPVRFFLCRYGGDEFVMAGANCSSDDVVCVKALINEELKKKNAESSAPYTLSFSVGMASGVCCDYNDVECLLHAADKAMYEVKNATKAARLTGEI